MRDQLETELRKICLSLSDRPGIDFDVNRTLIQDKKRVDPDKKVTEARLYFHDFYGQESELILAIRLDVTEYDRRYLPVQQRMLIHPYSDVEACSTSIRCIKLEEILASKMRCLLQRKHIADLFDLVFAVLINRDIEVDRRELLATFFRITIFGREPGVVKALLVDLPLESFRRFWTDYITCPVTSWFDFDRAKTAFLEFIETILPGRAERGWNPIFFTSVFRNTILAAADEMTLLRLAYDGVERLVEPYELAFKIRKDLVGREYFYAYDRTGGRSSGPGLKAFVPEKTTKVENTTEKFEPQFPIEIRKAGSAESVKMFPGRPGGTPNSGMFVSQRRRARTKKHSGFGNIYTVICPYCNKRFRRETFDSKLNPHKDKYGNPCPGRQGMIV